jgi:glycosyltransferase involved in cell wall biosynthesis
MARALRDAGVDLRIYTLTQGQFHEATLKALGCELEWVGSRAHPLLRLHALARRLRGFRPHVIQSTHSFANLYAGLLGRWLGCIGLGSLRSSLGFCRQGNGVWTPWLIRVPHAILVNAQTALGELTRSRLVAPRRLFWLPNAIDLSEYGQPHAAESEHRRFTAIFVGRLIPVKRIDRFLRALALAVRQEPTVRALILGEGSERAALERLAGELSLGPEHVEFLGQQSEVPRWLRASDVLVHCSDDEGLPNAVLEAMAARLPVITTPAGDAPRIIRDGYNGYVVPFEDLDAMAERLLALVRSPSLRRRLGEAGRHEVELDYSLDGLAERLLSIYRTVAEQYHLPFPCGERSETPPSYQESPAR